MLFLFDERWVEYTAMEFNIIFILLSAVFLIVGSGAGYWFRQNLAKKQLSTAEGQPAKMLEKAEAESKELTLEAKNKAVEILEEAKKAERAREEKIASIEERIEKRESLAEK